MVRDGDLFLSNNKEFLQIFNIYGLVVDANCYCAFRLWCHFPKRIVVLGDVACNAMPSLAKLTHICILLL